MECWFIPILELEKALIMTPGMSERSLIIILASWLEVYLRVAFGVRLRVIFAMFTPVSMSESFPTVVEPCSTISVYLAIRFSTSWVNS